MKRATKYVEFDVHQATTVASLWGIPSIRWHRVLSLLAVLAYSSYA